MDAVLLTSRIDFTKKPYKRMEIAQPMGLMFLKSVLKNNNISSVIIDTYARDLTISKLLDEIKGYNPKYVCISIYSDFVRGAVQLIEALKDYHVIVGGPHITHDKEFINKYPVKTAVINEGENRIAKVIIDRETGLIDGGICDLTTLPLPDRNVDYAGYYSGGFKGSDKVSIHTSRGCPYSCIFCSQYYQKVRYHEIGFIEKDIDYCKNVLKSKFISFTDDNLLLNKKRFMAVCQVLKKYNIGWSCIARADAVDDDRMKAAKDSNLKSITIGIECGNEEIRNNIVKKNILDKDIYKAKNICDKYNLDAQFFFMAGFPTETIKDMSDTVKMAHKLKCIFFAACPPVCYPDTEIFDIALSENKIASDCWDRVANGETSKLPIYYPDPFKRDEFVEYSKRMVYGYYLSFEYILIALLYSLKSNENFKTMRFHLKEFINHLFKKFILKKKTIFQ